MELGCALCHPELDRRWEPNLVDQGIQKGFAQGRIKRLM
jgi:hypothetical protein